MHGSSCYVQGLLSPHDQITELLEKSPVWSAYKDQKHDLFISDAPIAGYLTGPATGVAGYLTAGTSTSTAAMSTPPPLREEGEGEGEEGGN